MQSNNIINRDNRLIGSWISQSILTVTSCAQMIVAAFCLFLLTLVRSIQCASILAILLFSDACAESPEGVRRRDDSVFDAVFLHLSAYRGADTPHFLCG
ncbi:MAG: hypothetical protein KDA80_12440, partial [Planctomycetaceae bacterium]|nr:hypothetical protein [Planctomycetaceae bacterium]